MIVEATLRVIRHPTSGTFASFVEFRLLGAVICR